MRSVANGGRARAVPAQTLPPLVVVRGDEVPGSKAVDLHPSIEAKPGDLRVNKRMDNAFWRTELEEQLRASSVEMLILSGRCAENCVLDTFRGARERGFPAAPLRSGIASPHADRIRLVEDICEVVSYGALEGWMK